MTVDRNYICLLLPNGLLQRGGGERCAGSNRPRTFALYEGIGRRPVASSEFRCIPAQRCHYQQPAMGPGLPVYNAMNPSVVGRIHGTFEVKYNKGSGKAIQSVSKPVPSGVNTSPEALSNGNGSDWAVTLCTGERKKLPRIIIQKALGKHRIFRNMVS
jgi:hypothetical protein